MKTEYKGHSKKSGVYKIVNLQNNRIYIGSAREFKERCKGHLRSLQQNKHANKFLQADFNKSGEENFLFEVIEVTEGSTEERRLIEQKHIDQHFDRGVMCYNLVSKTIQTKRVWSHNPEETKKKMSKAGKGRIFSEEHRKRLSEAAYKRKVHNKPPSRKGCKDSEETKQKKSQAQKLIGNKPPIWPIGKKRSVRLQNAI
jgi:group I intron endonuclease